MADDDIKDMNEDELPISFSPAENDLDGGYASEPSPNGQDATETEEEMGGKKKRRLAPLLIGSGVVIILLAAYVGLAAYFAGRTPANASIAGVDIGGMTEKDARAKLESATGDLVTNPVPITVEGTDLAGDIDPQAANVTLDYDAMISRLTGFTLNPVLLWDRVSGGGEEDVILTYDEDSLSAQLTDLNEQIQIAPEDATISFAGSTIETTDEVEGTGIDVDEAAQIIGDGWVSAPRPISVPATSVDPEVTNEDIEQVRADKAEPLVSGPVEVMVGDTQVTLTPADLAAAATFEVSDGAVDLTLDSASLVQTVRGHVADELPEPRDAKIQMDGHTAPMVIESVNGKSIDDDDTAALIETAAFSSDADKRTVEAEVNETEPELTTEKANELGVKEVVASIETPLTSDSVRTQNLIVGTEKTNNTLVLPGEEFSLLTQLGPIDAEHGFVSSGVVVDGFNSTAMGGGLSQLSTNTFNLGYRGGMEDIQHKPHSKYFSRYPMGVESTVWSPDLDMRWKNNSPYAVLVETWVAGGYVHSRLWSTKYYDVNISVSDPYNYREPGVKVNNSPDCVPYGAGGPGFTVDVHRLVTHAGETVYDDAYSWTYQPVDAARCE